MLPVTADDVDAATIASREEQLPVAHVLDALGRTGAGLWGKERVVELLMLAQRQSGELAPRMITFEPSFIGDVMQGHGFEVDVLESRHRAFPMHSLPALLRALRRQPCIVHTHGYKANVVARAARLAGAPMRGLVATCHGWTDESAALRLYNVLDRRTSVFSDVITAPDAPMLELFPKRARCVPVPNALPDIVLPSASERAEARTRFGLPSNRTAIGFLARTSAAKGILELLEAARLTAEEPIVWAIAGTGELDDRIREAALPNVRFVGYLTDAAPFRASLDGFVQTSRAEGLSLSLLEAMREAIPIIATDVGSTTFAVRDGIEARIIPPKDSNALAAAARELARDPQTAARRGTAARERFLAAFHIERQHRAFLNLYRSALH